MEWSGKIDSSTSIFEDITSYKILNNTSLS
jgi:hypothetical protein